MSLNISSQKRLKAGTINKICLHEKHMIFQDGKWSGIGIHDSYLYCFDYENIFILANLLNMLQEDIKIFACSIAGKYYDIFPESKEIVGITHDKYFYLSNSNAKIKLRLIHPY